MSTYALSVASTILSTILIVVRILYVARIPGTTRQPYTVIEVVVESAALYSISALIYIVMLHEWIVNLSLMDLYGEIFCSNMAVSKISLESLSSSTDILFLSQNISPALIMLRVVLRRAYPDANREWSDKMSELQFGSTGGPGAAPPQMASVSRDVSGTTSTVPQNHIYDEQDGAIELAPGFGQSERYEQ
jgi:hypothetical protein